MTPMKLAFIGEPGSGKTTCIGALSDVAPVDTDVACTDELAVRKATTTVAMDFGVMDLGPMGCLHLYGLPGQSRFRFMFDIVRSGLIGVVVLVDASSPDGLSGFEDTLQNYADALRGLPCVVALNKARIMDASLPATCQERLRAHRLLAPVLRVDARHRDDVTRIAGLILTMLTYNRRIADQMIQVE